MITREYSLDEIARGYEDTSIEAVLQEAGVSRGSLYHHFASKQEILVQIATETMTDLFQGGTRAVESEATAEEKLRALVEWNVVFHAERRLPARVADEELRSLGSAARQAVVGIRDEYEALFRAILKQGQAESGHATAPGQGRAIVRRASWSTLA